MYFVMLSLNNGMPTPMVDDNGDPAMFETREEAELAANNNPLGRAYQWGVYEWY